MVSKLSAARAVLWTDTFSATSPNSIFIAGVAVAADGSVLVAGSFDGTVDFNPGSGTDSRTSAGGAGYNDAFLTLLNSTGTYGWTRVWGATSTQDNALRVAIAADGTILVVGDFIGTVDFDPGAGDDSKSGPRRLETISWACRRFPVRRPVEMVLLSRSLDQGSGHLQALDLTPRLPLI